MNTVKKAALNATLIITDMYNGMEKLRNGEILNTRDQKIHAQDSLKQKNKKK